MDPGFRERRQDNGSSPWQARGDAPAHVQRLFSWFCPTQRTTFAVDFNGLCALFRLEKEFKSFGFLKRKTFTGLFGFSFIFAVFVVNICVEMTLSDFKIENFPSLVICLATVVLPGLSYRFLVKKDISNHNYCTGHQPRNIA